MRLFKIVTRLAVLCPLTLSLCQAQVSYKISTIAGNATSGFTGDGATATSAELANPTHITVDSSGNLWIADQGNSRIRQVSGGNINTKAGTTTSGYAGDNAAATDAKLTHPSAIAFDSGGNYYISDTDNAVIRKVTSGGTISTFAGSNTNGQGYSGDGGKPTDAQINRPLGIVVDGSGNIYFADSGNHRIRKISSASIISTIAGTGSPSYSGDGGPAAAASINNPQGVAIDASGNLYFADEANHRIRKIGTDGTITTVAGNGTAGFSGDYGLATAAMLNSPRAVAVDKAGNLYIADYNNSRVRRVSTDGRIQTIAGNGQFGYYGDGYAATAAALKFPSGVAVDANANVYISDTQNNVIRYLVPGPATPTIAPNGVAGAAAFGGSKGVAPGSWIEIYGTNLSNTTRAWAASDFNGAAAPTSLDGVTVTIGPYFCYISYVSPGQVNAQVPPNVPLGPAQLNLNAPGGSTNGYTLIVNRLVPGMLAPPSFIINGLQYVAALSADSASYIAPAGSVTGVNSRPAKVGETITLYGTGFGPVSPDPGVGFVTGSANSLVNAFTLSFAGTKAAVTYAGLAPGVLGLYQFNVVVPNVTPGNAIPVTYTIDGQDAPQVLYTAVQ